MKREKIACRCHRVTYGMIEDAVRAGASTPEEVAEATRCGKGCGKCMEFITYLIRDIKEEQTEIH